MDSLPYVDTLFKEYLLFRGFTATLQSFGTDLAVDRCCGFQAEALCELIFGQLLPQCRTAQLMELLDLLAERLFSQLDGRFEALVERMEVALIKAALVTCVRAGKQDKVAEFFRQHGDSLLSGPEAGVWRQWAALAFVPTPRKDPAFQAYFNPEWMSLLEVSFRNFLSQVMAALPLPAVLRFNADRRQRLALQQQVDSLQRQLEAVTRQLAAAQVAATAAAAAAATVQPVAEDEASRAARDAAPATATSAVAASAPTGAAAAPGVTQSRGHPAAVDGVNAATAPAVSGGSGAGAASSGNGGGGGGAPAASVSGAATASDQTCQGQGSSDDAGRPPMSSASPPPPSPPRLPSPTSPPQQSQPQPQQHPHHPPHHHGRTLSLEAWHAVVDAEDAPEAAASPVPIPLGTSCSTTAGGSQIPAAGGVGGGDAGGRGAGRTGGGAGGGSYGTSPASFEGFAAAAEPGAGSPPIGRAPNGDGAGGGGSRRDAPAPAAPPPSSPPQRSMGCLPPLAEGDVDEPAATPPPRPTRRFAAAAGAAGVGESGGHGAGSGDAAADDVDVDADVDPAVMLVSGPTEPRTGVHGRAFGSSGSIATTGDGGDNGDGDDGEDDDATATATATADEGDEEEEPDGGQGRISRGTSGSGSGGGGGGGGAAAAASSLGASAAGTSVGSSSSASLPNSHSKALPVPPRPPPGGGSGGGGGAAAAPVIGGGRWQGINAHFAPPGSLHGRGAAVLAAQFSPGGGHNVATGAADGSLAIWSPLASSSGSASTREARLACGAPVTCVAWDARADKVMLVGTAGHGTLAWHADTRRAAAELPPDPAFPWVSQLAASRKEPVFIVAAATAPPPGARAAADAAAAAAAMAAAPAGGGSVHRVLSSPPHPPSSHQPRTHRHQGAAAAATATGSAAGAAAVSPSRLGLGGGSGGVSSGSSSSSSGRLSLWHMRTWKRVSTYSVPQNSPVLSLAFNSQGSWFAAGTCCGDVHLYDSSSAGSKPNPLSSFRANATSGGSLAAAPPASAPAAVQVYDSSAETVLVTCCGATVRLWSLRRLAEPLLTVPLLPYLPYGGGAGSGWSPEWAPSMCLSPRGAAAAVVLGGGSPAVYVVDLQGSGGDDPPAPAAAAASGASGGGGSFRLAGVFGSPATASLSSVGSASSLSRTAAVAAAVGRVSVVLPYCGGGLGFGTVGAAAEPVATDFPSYDTSYGGGGGGGDEYVYGTSCSWHPTRDVVVVGYSDGAVQAMGLSRANGGGG